MNVSFWRQIVLSFSSGGFYQLVVHQPFSRSLRYLTLLVLLASLVLSVRYAFILSRTLGELEVWALRYLPEIRIERGEVKSLVAQPWRYEQDQFVAILDTTGQTQDVPSEFPQGLLLSRRQLILKRHPSDIRRYDLSTIDSFRLNAETVSRLRRKGIWFFWPILLGGFFGYFMVGKLCQVVLFSGISLVTSRVSGRFLSYRALLTIGVYAVTLPYLLGVGLLLLGPPSPFFGLLFVSVYGALLVTAVLHSAPPQEPASEPTL